MASDKKHEHSSSSASPTEAQLEILEQTLSKSHSGHGPNTAATDGAAPDRLGASRKMANPLAGLSPQRLAAMGEDYARLAGLTSEEDMRAFRLGAMIAGDHAGYSSIPELTDREREVLERETTHKWSNPAMLYWVIASEW